ncbi:MAG: patatin family protein [Acidobacteria bacterium]|nr:MAG: patatin family protein [Acidobacteriota bacterium]
MSRDPRQHHDIKIGLALGGGGAKGIAHIGVLKVLEEYHIPIHCIAGTSVGALIGGAYASGMSLTEMIRLARKLRWSDLGKITLSRLGLRDGSRMESFIRQHFPVTTFEELRIPLAVVATDICTGTKRTIKEGDLARAIRASCAIPGYFTPVMEKPNRMLVDGGVVESLPVSELAPMGADCTIAVDVYPFSPLEHPPTNLYQIHMQAMSIMGYVSANHSRKTADLLIVPPLNHIAWDDLERADEIMAAGEEAMRRAMKKCLQLLKRKRPGLLTRWRSAWAKRAESVTG